MAKLNELLARWFLKRLRRSSTPGEPVETTAVRGLLEEQLRLVEQLKAAAKSRAAHHALLKDRHQQLKRKAKEFKELLRTSESNRHDLQTRLRLETQQKQALEWELGLGLARPGIAPLAGTEEKREWNGFYRHWRDAWEHTMRLGVLRQHEPKPPQAEAFPDRDPPDAPDTWPTVSIVTPSYQQVAFLPKTMASVLQQNYPKIQYRVIDGGSTDGSVEVLRRHEADLAGWSSAPDTGAANAINRGFADSTGEIMAWLNSDDLLMPGAVRFVADYFMRHPEVDAVYGHRIIIDERDRQVGRWVLPPHDAEMLQWADYVPQETLFWRRSLWEKVGSRLDESFGFAFDWDLLLRFEQAGARLVRLPYFLGCFRVHDAQKSIAEINGTGRAEVARIRQRVLGQQFTEERLERRAVHFQRRALWHDRLLRWGLRWPPGWKRRAAPQSLSLVKPTQPDSPGAVDTVIAFCTYFDLLYAAPGIAMLHSLLRHCPRARITVLCLDDRLEEILAEAFDSRVETMRLGVLTTRKPELKTLLPERDPWERYALLKPFLIEMLLDRQSAGGQLTFVDADMFFFADPTPLFGEATGSVAISPHRFNAETDHLKDYGRFNAGFNIWRNDAAARACLRQWREQCSAWCHCRVEPDGRFMDQGYLTDWPQVHPAVVTLSHPGHNLAPWNVGSHRLTAGESGVKADGRPLLFFHFSGVQRDDEGCWKTYYTLPSMRQEVVLQDICQPYFREVEAIRSRLLGRYGCSGCGSVREQDPSVALLELSTPRTRGMMIWLPSYPRSGNRLARLILHSVFTANTATIYSQVGEPDKNPPAPEWTGPFPDPRVNGVSFDECFFVKTHEMPTTGHPAIYIARDGRDAYVSYAHFVRQHFPEHVQGMSYLEVLKMLVESTGHFGGWTAHVQAWTSRPHPTAVIHFEDMVADPAGTMAAACAKLGIQAPAPRGRLPGFDELKAAEPVRFRRGKVGGWRDEMPAEIEELFWSLHGPTMTALGYQR